MTEQQETSKQELSNLMTTLKTVKEKLEQAKVCCYVLMKKGKKLTRVINSGVYGLRIQNGSEELGHKKMGCLFKRRQTFIKGSLHEVTNMYIVGALTITDSVVLFL